MRVAIVGAGRAGGRAARYLLDHVDELAVVDARTGRAEALCRSLGSPARAHDLAGALDGAGVVVLATPAPQRALAEAALDAGAHVVSLSDGLTDVVSLLDLGPEGYERSRTIAVGAGFCPGLSDVLAKHAAATFDVVDEIHVARSGTGGPACARQHHRALAEASVAWRDGAWVRRGRGAGRELVWFPDPVGAMDCYAAALPDPKLLVPAFADVRRVTARQAATRRDRVSSRLPMLRRPHPEGSIGALRVEVRGRRGATSDTSVLGALDRPAAAAAAVASVSTRWILDGRIALRGAAGLATLVDETAAFLRDLADLGVRAATFEGAG